MWTECNQREWAISTGNEAGVCRALVLVWLHTGEIPNKENADHFRMVKEIMGDGVNLKQYADILPMNWKNGRVDDPRQVAGADVATKLGNAEEVLYNLGRYLIGVKGPSTGHAVGARFSSTELGFYEPNKGFGRWPLSESAVWAVTMHSHLEYLLIRYDPAEMHIWEWF